MGRGLVPYLCCAGAAAAIDFYTTTFGAVEVERWTADDGRIGHAELTLAGEPLVIKVNGAPIGRAEVVVAGEQYGLKVIDLDGLNLDMLTS